MKTFDLDHWEEFEPKVDELFQKFAVYKPPRPPINWPVRFRGHASADWRLASTLERHSRQQWSVSDYLKTILSIRSQIESQTSHRWIIPAWEECVETMSRKYDGRVRIPHYDYWVYLRHHSFPSPLLDWSSSSLIAAYFAFSELPPVPCDRVAVFMYVEMPNGHKGWDPNKPHLTAHGTEASLDPRHFNQECWYTTATVRRGTEFYFVSHEDVSRPNDDGSDLILKITLPTSERSNALSYLSHQGITGYAMYGTEDALAKDLSIACFHSALPTVGTKGSADTNNPLLLGQHESFTLPRAQ